MKAFVIRIASGIHMQATPQQAREGNAFEMHAVFKKRIPLESSIGYEYTFNEDFHWNPYASQPSASQ